MDRQTTLNAIMGCVRAWENDPDNFTIAAVCKEHGWDAGRVTAYTRNMPAWVAKVLTANQISRVTAFAHRKSPEDVLVNPEPANERAAAE